MRASTSNGPYPATKSASTSSGSSPYRILGAACIGAFLIDMLLLAIGPGMGSLEWRVTFLKNLGDRSIVFLLGTAFMMIGTVDMRTIRKQLSMACLVLGMAFLMMTGLSIWDASVLQKQAITSLTTQTAQIEDQIQKAKDQPIPTGGKVTPEQIQQALDRLSNQSTAVQKNTTTQVIKTGASSAGNLMVVGIAMIALGRYGMRR
jgi:predicted PurR-regulated permease PerM